MTDLAFKAAENLLNGNISDAIEAMTVSNDPTFILDVARTYSDLTGVDLIDAASKIKRLFTS